MAAVCRSASSVDSQEDVEMETERERERETETSLHMHERLVAYVQALQHGSRRGVWGEHSYARARGASGVAGGGRGRARALLAPRPPSPPPELVDAESADAPPPSPPRAYRSGAALSPAHPPDDEEIEEEWEARVPALAPSPTHARLAADAVSALTAMRLERLAGGGGGGGDGGARLAARRLRRALAGAWVRGEAAAWLHATLLAHLPRSSRRLYEEAVDELRRAVPRLAERLTGSRVPSPNAPAPLPSACVPPDSDPWLVWVSSGCASLDARWERRLAAQVHTRVLRVPPGGGAGGEAPEAWCASAAGAVRGALTDALAEAGSRSVVLGGVGAGASLCLLLARGAGAAGGEGGVRGAVLAAPALRTAAGGRGARDDALHAVRLPLLLVVGTHAADSSRAIANDACEAGGSRRVLEVVGADAQLRVPRRVRERLRLPQHALDAALVEECVRWAVETAEGGAGGAEGASSPPPAPPPARRRVPPAVVHRIDLAGPDEEYAHLPATAPPAPPAISAPPAPLAPLAPPAPTHAQHRSIEIVEGRVVSRAPAGTPLTLLPPRRTAPPAPPAPSRSDIMQMPIVFADDSSASAPPPPPPPDAAAAGSPVTVTAAPDMRRVIVAKRGAGGGARRVLLRRGIRLVPRRDAHAHAHARTHAP